MRQAFQYLGLFLVVLIISLIYGHISARRSTHSARPKYLASVQPSSPTGRARRFRAEQFARVAAINGSEGLRRPEVMRVDGVGDVFVLDWGDFRIKSFSPSGAPLRTYGAGAGTGVGQVVNPTDLALSQGGRLWISDPSQRKLVGFSIRGSGVRTIRTRARLLRVTPVDGGFAAMRVSAGPGLFAVYTSAGAPVREFGQLIEDQDRFSMALDGWITADEGTGTLFYSGLHEGVLASFGAHGNVRYIVRTVDGAPLPTVSITALGLTTLKDPRLISSLSIDVLKGKLYVLSGPGIRGRREDLAIDVYDENTGEYQYSFRCPALCRQVIVREGRIYTLGPDGVTVWAWHQW